MANERLAKNAKVIFILLLLAGILVVDYMTARDVATRIASTDWPTAEGWVVTSRVAQSHDRDGMWYYPEVTYRYAVAGVEYVGKEAMPPVNPWKVVEEYPPSRRVTVFYNPNSPSQGVLRTGFNATGDKGCILALSFVAVPTLVIWLISVMSSRPAEKGL